MTFVDTDDTGLVWDQNRTEGTDKGCVMIEKGDIMTLDNTDCITISIVERRGSPQSCRIVIPAEDAPDFLAGLQAWIEQL